MPREHFSDGHTFKMFVSKCDWYVCVVWPLLNSTLYNMVVCVQENGSALPPRQKTTVECTS